MYRCFVAIDFPDEVIKEVARVQEVLRNLKFTGKTTELENIHLTLKFFGEINSEKLEKVRRKLREVNFGRMELKLGNVGIFSYRGKPGIVWIKILGNGIYELQERIDSVLSEIGFKKEERFMGHLTIARVKYVKDVIGFRKYVNNIRLRDVKFDIDKFKLKESELRNIGPVYKTVEEYICYDYNVRHK